MSVQDRRRLLKSLRERVAPGHTALLVVDMQHDYVSPGGVTDRRGASIASAQAIVPTLQALVNAARQAGTLVVFIQMTMDADLRVMSDAEYLRRSARWADEPITVEGTWGHKVITQLAPLPDELIVRKHRSCAFTGTDLDQILRSNHVQSVVVTGVVTNGCVNSTARGAMLHDYYVTVVSDAVAGPRQDLHDAALLLLAHQLGPDGVVEASRIVAEWAAVAPAATAGSS